ncbi:single-stranded DNA-binding protein [Sphingomonadales bacterium 58]|uniref:single-stranded DNA-binding protein n=1 Tax=Sphingobium sp. S8 TaxID=2758385 RepID=UPI0019192158|nr:single-stranded DNA-binding protein [Sphingobium sp. S8]MBY2957578.1 single-stranded DNA-binding protein [Sphingomonadales bacterium 58]CAD7335361.1 Single-stranded DNA-binding protein [Sphingobium sp. S8]
MLNEVRLIGNVGADPEIRSTQGGDKVASIRLATSERWKDRQSGEKKERTEWHSIVVFGPLVQVVERFVHKGSKLFIGGQLRTRKWQDQAGNDRWSTEIVLSGFDAKLTLLDSAGGGQGQRDYSSYQEGPGFGGSAGAGAGGGGGYNNDLDDEVPF